VPSRTGDLGHGCRGGLGALGLWRWGLVHRCHSRQAGGWRLPLPTLPAPPCISAAPAVARGSMGSLNMPVNFFRREITLSFLDLWSELQNT